MTYPDTPKSVFHWHPGSFQSTKLTQPSLTTTHVAFESLQSHLTHFRSHLYHEANIVSTCLQQKPEVLLLFCRSLLPSWISYGRTQGFLLVSPFLQSEAIIWLPICLSILLLFPMPIITCFRLTLTIFSGDFPESSQPVRKKYGPQHQGWRQKQCGPTVLETAPKSKQRPWNESYDDSLTS